MMIQTRHQQQQQKGKKDTPLRAKVALAGAFAKAVSTINILIISYWESDYVEIRHPGTMISRDAKDTYIFLSLTIF